MTSKYSLRLAFAYSITIYQRMIHDRKADLMQDIRLISCLIQAIVVVRATPEIFQIKS